MLLYVVLRNAADELRNGETALRPRGRKCSAPHQTPEHRFNKARALPNENTHDCFVFPGPQMNDDTLLND